MDRIAQRSPKYKIAWLPGDGVGVDVLDAARIVLEKIRLDAEYIPGDIGWEYWRTEGDQLEITASQVFNKTSGLSFAITPFPPSPQAIIDLGGLIPYTRQRLLQRNK